MKSLSFLLVLLSITQGLIIEYTLDNPKEWGSFYSQEGLCCTDQPDECLCPYMKTGVMGKEGSVSFDTSGFVGRGATLKWSTFCGLPDTFEVHVQDIVHSYVQTRCIFQDYRTLNFTVASNRTKVTFRSGGAPFLSCLFGVTNRTCAGNIGAFLQI